MFEGNSSARKEPYPAAWPEAKKPSRKLTEYVVKLQRSPRGSPGEGDAPEGSPAQLEVATPRRQVSRWYEVARSG
jgi:hypothetical protein